MFVNGVKIYNIKAKNSEIKPYPLCLGSVSEDFTVDNPKKAGSNGYAYDFSVCYNIIDVRNIVDIHNYFMKKYNRK